MIFILLAALFRLIFCDSVSVVYKNMVARVTETSIKNDAPDPACLISGARDLSEILFFFKTKSSLGTLSVDGRNVGSNNNKCFDYATDSNNIPLSGNMFALQNVAVSAATASLSVSIDCFQNNCLGTFGGKDCEWDSDCGLVGESDDQRDRASDTFNFAVRCDRFSASHDLIVCFLLGRFRRFAERRQ
jgi:hypothetical protein